MFILIKLKEYHQRKIQVMQFLAACGFVWTCELCLQQPQYVLTMALVFEMINNLMQLGTVPRILKSKAKSSVNVPVTICCTIDAFVWFLYALVKQDVIYMVLNAAGVMQGILKWHLYEWVHGRRADSDLIITSMRQYWRLGV